MRPRRRSHAARLPGLASLASLASLACLALLATGAHGGEAVRYRDGQGIEIIGDRAAAMTTATPQLPALAAPRTGPARLQLPPHEQPAALTGSQNGPHERQTAPLRLQIVPHKRQAAPLRMQITAHEQQARDRDRLAILRQELDAELAAMQENIAHSRGLAHEPLRRSREQLRRHQQNIRDLHAEISRAVKAAK